MPSQVTAIPAAPAHLAEAHFAAEFTFEADCWDVHDALAGTPDFVLLDAPTRVHLAYRPGVPLIRTVWIDGVAV